METKFFAIQSPFDGLTLQAAAVTPEGCPKAVVQFAHGMGEHKEPYFPVMKYLAQYGFASVVQDDRGHGGSVKAPEDLGYFYTEDSNAMVEDFHEVTKWAKQAFPGVPIYLVGMSMGTLLVRCYLQKYDTEVEKVVLIGPPTENALVDFGIVLAQLSKPFYQPKKPNRFLAKLAVGNFNNRFENEGEWLCRNAEAVAAFAADPLCGATFTTSGFCCLFGLQKGAFNPKWKAQNPALHLYVMAGEEDTVVGGAKKLRSLIVFLSRRGYQDVRWHVFAKDRHDLLHETDAKEKVYPALLAFLNEN